MTRAIAAIALTIGVGLCASACQSTASRQAELQAICADPANRQPQSFYWSECQTIDPSTPKQLEKDYQSGAPVGKR